jgi:hypothetical protein
MALKCSINIYETVQRHIQQDSNTHNQRSQNFTLQVFFAILHVSFAQFLLKYCQVYEVSLDGVWIGDVIYWPLIHSRLVTTLYR